MGEAYDQCGVRARPGRGPLSKVRIFADAPAAVARMTHGEPDPGQTFQAMKAIAALHEREPTFRIEFRRCPAHKGIPGNEVANGWAKQATSEPYDCGVEWLSHANKYERQSILGVSERQGIGEEMDGSPIVVRAETTQHGVCAPKERQT